jgi:hypothetical protein
VTGRAVDRFRVLPDGSTAPVQVEVSAIGAETVRMARTDPVRIINGDAGAKSSAASPWN